MRRFSMGVVAYEPNPKMFKVLKACAKPGVAVHQVALSDQSGLVNLMIPQGTKGFSNQGASLSRLKIGDVPHRTVSVRQERLDDLDIGPIGFMKIDVEGHELAVLEGAKRVLKSNRPNLIIEIEEKHLKRSISDVLGYIKTFGYDAFALRNGTLVRVEMIDLAVHHTNPLTRADYIFNWVFLPQ